MRFRAPSFLLFSLSTVVVMLFFPACSGHTTGTGVAKITVSPTIVSASRGDVVQLSLSAADATGGIISADYNFVSADPTLATVSAAGQICAGVWDSHGVVCTPATHTGQTTIVITPQKGSATATVTVYVHEKVDGIVANEPTGCTSSTQVTNVSATAFSNDPAVCSSLGEGAPPCEIPASTLGPLTWAAVNGSVVTFSNSLNNPGAATATTPGKTQIYASIGNLRSPAVSFTTCPIVTLVLCTSTPCTAPPATSTFSLAAAGTEPLYAEAVDSKGTSLVSPNISWLSSNTYAIALAETAATTTTTATTLAFTATGSHAGSYATILAVCVNPVCNIGLAPVYSNALIGQVTGTSSATIYAASTSSTTVVPINSSDNSLGTSATLNHVPTSVLADREGTKLLFGSDSSGVMLLSAGATTSTTLSINGRPLAFSDDGAYALISDAADKVLYLLTLSNSSAIVLSAPNGATGGGFTPDGATIWFTDGTDTLYTYSPNLGMLTFNLPAAATDVEFSENGPVAYLAGGAVNAIPVRATCIPDPTHPDHPLVDSLAADAPTMVRAIPNGSGAVVLDLPNLRVVSTSNVSQACPPTATDSQTVVALPSGALLNVANGASFFTTPDSSKAVVVSKTGVLDVVALSGGTATSVPITGSPATIYPGGTLADGSILYIGAGDHKVHKIDLTSNTDTTQIDPKLLDSSSNAVDPDLVVVAPK